jgi:hypothetical protein
MPRKSIKRIRGRKHKGLTERQREFLIRGSNYISPGAPPFEDLKDARRAWKSHRAEILGMIGKTGAGPCEPGIPWGKRPWAWWAFDGKRGQGHFRTLVDPRGSRWIGTTTSFGAWRIWQPGPGDRDPVFQSQLGYLIENDLLLDGEVEKAIKQKLGKARRRRHFRTLAIAQSQNKLVDLEEKRNEKRSRA